MEISRTAFLKKSDSDCVLYQVYASKLEQRHLRQTSLDTPDPSASNRIRFKDHKGLFLIRVADKLRPWHLLDRHVKLVLRTLAFYECIKGTDTIRTWITWSEMGDVFGFCNNIPELHIEGIGSAILGL